MLVHICDKCQAISNKTIYVLDGFRLVCDGAVRKAVDHKEFCSLFCLGQYLQDVLEEHPQESPTED